MPRILPSTDRQMAFVVIGKMFEEIFGRDELKDRVSQELQRLIMTTAKQHTHTKDIITITDDDFNSTQIRRHIDSLMHSMYFNIWIGKCLVQIHLYRDHRPLMYRILYYLAKQEAKWDTVWNS